VRGSSESLFVLDGEAVLLGVDGISDFNGLHSRKHDEEVQLYAFDILALEGRGPASAPAAPAEEQLGRAA
jgi:bifunctional non-homologous end joining protein LigD